MEYYHCLSTEDFLLIKSLLVLNKFINLQMKKIGDIYKGL